MPNPQILSTGYREKPLEKTRNKRQSDKGLSLQWGEGRDLHLSFFRVQYSTIMEINCQQLNAISRHDPCQLSSDISANADLNRSLITQRATCCHISCSQHPQLFGLFSVEFSVNHVEFLLAQQGGRHHGCLGGHWGEHSAQLGQCWHDCGGVGQACGTDWGRSSNSDSMRVYIVGIPLIRL